MSNNHFLVIFVILLLKIAPIHWLQNEHRYLLYDVNLGEGLNLRRDVYMRVANVVRQLRERGHDFILVLPPWTNIWHWKNRNAKITWSELFDLEQLKSFIPVIEYEEFNQKNGQNPIDLILYLQHYAEGWSESEGFLMKYDVRPCIEGQKYYRKIDDSKWEGKKFGSKLVTNEFKCLSIQGQSSTLVDAIIEHFPHRHALMADRAETILHDNFGDVFYWKARKSMQYSRKLKQIGDRFRQQKFPTNYFCAHWRRGDFVWSHRENIPSIEGTAKQLIKLANNIKLDVFFLCTDANSQEVEKLKIVILNEKNLRMERFGEEVALSDAAISIVDQWTCANAKKNMPIFTMCVNYPRWFIGTHQSTFSFRIHEDREILGFPPESTFNRFCPDAQIDECEQPAKWTIMHE